MSASWFTKPLYILGLCLWVILCFELAGATVTALIVITPGALSLNEAVLTTTASAINYVFALGLIIGLPWVLTRKRPSKKTLGISRLPNWMDIGLSILAVLPYYLLSAGILWFGMEVLKVIDPEVGQQIAFDNIHLRIEYLVAFVTLVVMAPLAEELLFRGYLMGRLSDKAGRTVAVLLSATVFGLMHLAALTDHGIVLQWGAAADTFAMGLTAAGVRLLSGSIWAGVLLHAIKNAIAYYFLFVNPAPPTGM